MKITEPQQQHLFLNIIPYFISIDNKTIMELNQGEIWHLISSHLPQLNPNNGTKSGLAQKLLNKPIQSQ